MKIAFASFLTLLNINFGIIPNADLLVIMGIVIALDFATGIAKSVMLKKIRTSRGYRQTIVKFLQYGGGIASGAILKHVSSKDASGIARYVDYCTTGLLIFIIFIEVTSILENVYEMDKKTPFSQYFIQPLLRILTFQIRNNPLTKQDPEKKEDKL